MMDWISLIIIFIIVTHILPIVLVIVGDCDVLLQLAEKFGKSPAVLKEKVVWITGASSGIGEFLAYDLAKAGCRLCLSARREAELERVKKECLLRGKTKEEDILVLPLDSLKYETHQAATDKVIKHFGQIDILVNNAGRSQRATWEDTDLEVDKEMLEVNVLGVLSLTKTVLPHMFKRREGHIVVTSSVAGKLGAPLSGSYTGAKHAIQGWFSALRTEVADRNITVTMLCPGPVFSNILDTAFTGKSGEELKGKMHTGEKRMATARCSELCAVAIANKLSEVWISRNPVLLILYFCQYFPNFSTFIMGKMGTKVIKKLREGQH